VERRLGLLFCLIDFLVTDQGLLSFVKACKSLEKITIVQAKNISSDLDFQIFLIMNGDS